MKILFESFVWALFILACFFAIDAVTKANAQAAFETVSISWDPVTTREDGSEIGSEEGNQLLYYVAKAEPQGEGGAAEPFEVEIGPEKTQFDIQVVANECYTFTMYSVASPGPACKPEQHYQMSAPSNTATNCVDTSLRPEPPRDFGG